MLTLRLTPRYVRVSVWLIFISELGGSVAKGSPSLRFAAMMGPYVLGIPFIVPVSTLYVAVLSGVAVPFSNCPDVRSVTSLPETVTTSISIKISSVGGSVRTL